MKSFTKTLEYLSQMGYYHHPHTPGQLKRDRKDENQLPLEQLFGLGLPVAPEKLNLPPEVAAELEIVQDQFRSPWCISSGLQGELVVHSHWPPQKDSGYVHLGPESFYVAEQLLKLSSPQKILDLGCAQGVLSSYVPAGSEVVGVDLDSEAIALARALHPQFIFHQHKIGDKKDPLKDMIFDLAVFNPPLAIPGETAMVHRDGGKQGLEIPLLFLDYAHTHLKPQGQAWFIAADPAIKGRFQILDRVKPKWEVLEYEILESHFNHAYEHKHQYKDKHGVDFVNLVLVKVQKR
jgi:SAM-dependent methyltransferase